MSPQNSVLETNFHDVDFVMKVSGTEALFQVAFEIRDLSRLDVGK